MGKLLPSEIQRWVTSATENGLSAASVRKYHTMLHSVFERAQRDRVVTFNPCAHTKLPKVVKKKARTLTTEEYVAIVASLPAQHRLMVETAINTGLRWGELIALKPRHLDLIKRTLTVEETVVEVSIKNSPTGARMLTKPYPKDNEARTMGLPADLVGQLADWITTHRLGGDDLLFATREGTPISRNTFRTRVWRPAIKASRVDFDVRVHDLRHAHASWLLAGGSDLKSLMDRMGHAQINTTQKYLHTLPDPSTQGCGAGRRTSQMAIRASSFIPHLGQLASFAVAAPVLASCRRPRRLGERRHSVTPVKFTVRDAKRRCGSLVPPGTRPGRPGLFSR